MANLGNFNPEDFKNEYEPIPAGKYHAVITESEEKPTAKGGMYIKLTVEIIEGQYKGRKVFANLNMVNANPEAVKIAKITLADICRATGVLHPRDSSELHNKPLTVKLSVRPETDQYPASNDVKGWEGLDATPSLPGMYPEPKNEPMPTSDNKKPWER